MSACSSPRGSSLCPRPASCESRLLELEGFVLTVDRGAVACRGERSYAVADLAGVFGRQRTVSEVLHRMCCAGCGGVVAAAWLAPGPVLNRRVRARRWH